MRADDAGGARRVSEANQLPGIDTKNESHEVYTGSRSAWMRGDDHAERDPQGAKQDAERKPQFT
jgi:hypothetical protein